MMNIRFHIPAALLLLATGPFTSLAQNNEEAIQVNKQRAMATAREGGYKHLITQHAPNGQAPDPKLFEEWILTEINNNSAMRDQIGDELAEIQNNGKNGNTLTYYYTRDKEHRGRLWFKPADVTSKSTGGKDGVYDYQTVLKAQDVYHRGFTIKSFKYTFKVKVEYFKFTKAYQVTVVGYPLYVGKTETDKSW